MRDLLSDDNFDPNRFEQELIYYVEKFEYFRRKRYVVANHLTYFIETLKCTVESNGKKLNFIAQEIGREINTIGSKANDVSIQHLVVQMKDELEKDQGANHEYYLMPGEKLPLSFFSVYDTCTLAQKLLGCELVHESPDGTTSRIIVETEAYLRDDPACHAFNRRTPRTEADVWQLPAPYTMYLIYGMYQCFNIVSNAEASEKPY